MKTARTAHSYNFLLIQILLLSVTLTFLSSCKDRTITASQPPTTAPQQLPTATEVFHLRSECAKLGAKILNDNSVGRALSQSQLSHYNSNTNRCYIELTVQSADMTKAPEIMSRYLFDGQTEEMLAFAKVEKGKQSGMAF